MTWAAAIVTGFGLGLASFGTLWWTVRQIVCRPHSRILVGASGLARLALVGFVLHGLGREGPDTLLAGLVGLWLARCCLIQRVRLRDPASPVA